MQSIKYYASARIASMVDKLINKKESNNSKKKVVISVLAIICLLLCVLTLGKPFATNVKIVDEVPAISFKVWNLTIYRISWECQLYYENGESIPAGYYPAFVTTEKPLISFGINNQCFQLVQPLPAGNYLFKISFQYEAWVPQKQTSEIHFTKQ